MTLRQCREGRGLSQDDLAKATGVTKAAISRIEQGFVPNPRYDTMVKLASGLGMSAEALHLAVQQSVRARHAAA